MGIGQNKAGTMYAIAGWGRVWRWMLENDPTCKSCLTECGELGFDEVDTLRMLCATLLFEKHGQL
jgi:hypothetical protein